MKNKNQSPTECEIEQSGKIPLAQNNDVVPLDVLKCTVCKNELHSSCFGNDKRKKNGLKSACQSCCNDAVRRWRNINPEKAREAGAKYRRANPEKHRARSREWYNENKELALRQAKEWRMNNSDHVRDYGREYGRRWRAANPERAKENARLGQRKRREDPIKRLEDAIKNGFYRGIRGISKAGHTFDLLGYSLDDLTSHLSANFSDGMSWENYGEWHVDHKVPLVAHNYKSPADSDFKKAWALDNLQPLWRFDNQSKGAKLMNPFQPSLALPLPANDNAPTPAVAA